MSWRAITESDVLAVLTETERAAVDTLNLGDQDSPVEAVIASVTDEARGRIAANPANQLGEDGTLPATVIHQAVAIIRYRLLSRLPVASLVTDARRAEWDEANKFFRDVAKGEVSIERPATAATETRATPDVDVTASVTRQATRTKLSGI